MSWCPKCKNEYKDGITICSDCGCELIDSLEEQQKPIYFGEKEEMENIVSFLNANHICDCVLNYDDTQDVYELVVNNKDKEKAKKALRVYLKEISCKEEEDEENKKEDKSFLGVYEDSGKKAEDYKTGAYTLLLVGITGIVVLLFLNLNLIPISLPQFTKILMTGVMGVLFIFFVILGFSSLKTCKKLQSKAIDEKGKEEEIKEWFLSHITKDMIDEGMFKMEDSSKEDYSTEELYFKRTDKIKEMIKDYYKELDASFTDYLVEEIYTKIYE